MARQCETLADWRNYFAGQSNSGLRACWSIWGRDSEQECSARLQNAWQAVNEEMLERGLH